MKKSGKPELSGSRITLRTSGALHEALRRYCKETDRTPSQAARKALRELIPAEFYLPTPPS